jgi:hypothetical protein
MATVDFATRGPSRIQCGSGTATMTDPPMAFAPNLIWHEAAGRIAVGSEAAYRVEFFESGRVTAVLRRDIPLVPTRPEYMARQYPEGMRLAIGPVRCVLGPDEIAKQFGVADHLPLIQGLLLSPDGGVWVERFSFPDEEPRIDIFDQEHAYVGTATGVGEPIGFLSNGRFVTLRAAETDGLFRLAIFQVSPAPW